MAANTARDLGGRLVAITIWGTKAWGGRYAAITALTNILSTLVAYMLYEFIFKDSSRGTLHIVIVHSFLRLSIHAVLVLTAIGKEFRDSHVARMQHRQRRLDSFSVPCRVGPDSERGTGVPVGRAKR